MSEEQTFGLPHSEFVDRVLSVGYLPEGVPPSFRAENLKTASKDYLGLEKPISTVTTEPVRYSASKRNGQRRLYSTPNPLAHIDLVNFLGRYSEEISEHFSHTKGSCSIPRPDKIGRRAYEIDSFSEFTAKRRLAFATSRYIVKTDISRYFPSIYTHSIPWALNGKQAAKKDRKRNSTEVFGNWADFTTRQSQDGQTVGIPVGPDTSRFLSEIIAVGIDRQFQSLAGDKYPFIRLVDDIFVGVDSVDEGQTVQSMVREAIYQYELDINENKTEVLKGSYDVEPDWPYNLRTDLNPFIKSENIELSDGLAILDKVLNVANQQNDEGVVKYAIRTLDKVVFWEDNWRVVEPFLVRAAISFPHSLDYVAWVVSSQNIFGEVDKRQWRTVIEKILQLHGPNGHDFEVCWALWMALELNVDVDRELLSPIFERCNSFATILAMDRMKTSGNDSSIPRSKIREKLGDLPMRGPDWLLAYEGDRLFGLKIKTKNLKGHDLFGAMYAGGVSFYQAGVRAFPLKPKEGEKRSPAIPLSGAYDDEEMDDDLAEAVEDFLKHMGEGEIEIDYGF